MSVSDKATEGVWRRRAGNVLAWLSWLYVAGLVGVWGFLVLEADRWWPGTVLMYAPKWVYGLPLIVLGPAAALLRWRLLGVLLVALVLVAGPLMGFCLPWRTFLAADAGGVRVRVMTCNIHFEQLDAAALARLIAETKPDIVALQYWKEKYGRGIFQPGEWQVRSGEPFCLGSRYPIEVVEPPGHSSPCKENAMHYQLVTPAGKLHFFNVHLSTPRQSLLAVLRAGEKGAAEVKENMAARRVQSAAISDWAEETRGPALIAGDFNMSTGSRIYRADWSKYSDAFSLAGLGWGYTEFSSAGKGVRIDHILAGPGWRCHRCWVGPYVGSEHRPLIADLEWTGARD